MKKIVISILALAGVVACNDASMDRLPKESQTEISAFETYTNFKTFSWSLYDIFSQSGNIERSLEGGGAACGYYRGDELAGYISKKGVNDWNKFSAQTATVPQVGGGWNFDYVRSVNTMLVNVDKSKMTQNEKDHWRSVGLFFHSFKYVELIMRFGDVPWIETVIPEKDALNNLERMPRTQVADKVMANLKWAEENINNGTALTVDGKNTINKSVVLALINRFGLWEGTWRKYHKSGGDATTYLNESVRAAELLMAQYPNIDNDYDRKFNTEDLSTYAGSILYKEYTQNVLTHQNCGIERSSSQVYQTHKFIVEMFLNQNGLPIKNANNTLYQGDKTMYDEFRNRDFRLLLNVTPPYAVTGAGSMNQWGYTNNPVDREYIDYMRANTRPLGKQLPAMNGAAPSYGSVTGNIPHFQGQDGQAYCVSRSGYYMWKSYNLEDNNPTAVQSFDRPIFAIEEVLLNYAEAKWELGSFSQAVADKTINKLRPRAKVAAMNVASIDATFDPARDPQVDPVLWEIRRERLTELMGEGFGFYDVRRWKTAPWFLNQKQLGCYVRKTDFGGLKPAAVTIDGPKGATEGYVYLFPDPMEAKKGWKDTYYLYPIPRQELTLNKKLVQNTGWELE